uniref:iron-containing alcohol dehydrogenase n=1 Tax=Sphingomonas daechungensis TaxID=1176646 RepID=UPI0037843AE6
PHYLTGYAFSGNVAVVSDPTTHSVLGQAVEHALSGKRRLTSIRLDDHPHADIPTVERVEAASRDCDALIAVGSGTINDICKYVAARSRRPYAVFATAPSMNGYVSTTAAISVHGHKKSLPACAPSVAVFDLGILSAAPKRMIRSGLGDSLCRATAQADWLLAHLLLDTPYRTMPFALLEEDEPDLFDMAGALVSGDSQAMDSLVRTLVLSGFGTAICGSSHPASQGEHLISHFVDMMGDSQWPAAFHGEHVGVTTISMARLQARCLELECPIVKAESIGHSEFSDIFGAELADECWAEYAEKQIDEKQAELLNARLVGSWDAVRNAVAKVAKSAGELEGVLRRAGAPVKADDLGWPPDFYAHAVVSARLIRNRFTFLDFGAAVGVPLT